MPAEQQKSGKWRIRKKDGTLGKRDFTSKKNALAAQRSGAKAGKKKPGTKVAKKAGTSATSSSSKKIGTGKSYQAVRLTMLAISPVTSKALAIQAEAKTVSGALTQLRTELVSPAYATHLGVVTADLLIDRSRMVGQAAALSRGSVTAWAPEVYIGVKGVEDWQRGVGAWGVHDNAIRRQTGYDPANGTWDARQMRTYRTIKHGGQIIRIAGNRIGLMKRLKRALQDSILRPIGATL